MSDLEAERRARELAHHLLRVGCLDPEDADDRALYEELIGNAPLYDRVAERLAGVGYTLHQFFGQLGVRPDRDAEAAGGGNTLGLHAGHIRLLVWLWVQLVYRQIKAAARDEEVEPLPGRSQALFDFADAPDEAPPEVSWAELLTEFSELYSEATIKQFLGTLRKHRFVVQRRRVDPITAGPSLYVMVDPVRMEEYVVGLARRGAMSLPDDVADGGEGGS